MSVFAAGCALCICGVASAGDLTISVQGECPGAVVVAWEEATPNTRSGLWFSRNLGEIRLPAGPCGGTILGLGTTGLRLARVFQSGPAGEGRMAGRIPPSACGAYLQMMVEDSNPCATSNVVQLPQ